MVLGGIDYYTWFFGLTVPQYFYHVAELYSDGLDFYFGIIWGWLLFRHQTILYSRANGE